MGRGGGGKGPPVGPGMGLVHYHGIFNVCINKFESWCADVKTQEASIHVNAIITMIHFVTPSSLCPGPLLCYCPTTTCIKKTDAIKMHNPCMHDVHCIHVHAVVNK